MTLIEFTTRCMERQELMYENMGVAVFITVALI